MCLCLMEQSTLIPILRECSDRVATANISRMKECKEIHFMKNMDMSRKKVDLTKLPPWQQYLIAVLVAGLVFGLVYLLKGNQPQPAWIESLLIEKPAITALALVVLLVFIWLVRRITRLNRLYRE